MTCERVSIKDFLFFLKACALFKLRGAINDFQHFFLITFWSASAVESMICCWNHETPPNVHSETLAGPGKHLHSNKMTKLLFMPCCQCSVDVAESHGITHVSIVFVVLEPFCLATTAVRYIVITPIAQQHTKHKWPAHSVSKAVSGRWGLVTIKHQVAVFYPFMPKRSSNHTPK